MTDDHPTTPRALPDEAVARLRRIVEREGPDFTLSIRAGELLALREAALSRHAPDGAADEAMVERVARALYESRSPAGAPTWKQRGKVFRAASIEDARRLLGVGGDGADGR